VRVIKRHQLGQRPKWGYSGSRWTFAESVLQNAFVTAWSRFEFWTPFRLLRDVLVQTAGFEVTRAEMSVGRHTFCQTWMRRWLHSKSSRPIFQSLRNQATRFRVKLTCGLNVLKLVPGTGIGDDYVFKSEAIPKTKKRYSVYMDARNCFAAFLESLTTNRNQPVGQIAWQALATALCKSRVCLLMPHPPLLKMIVEAKRATR